MYRACALALCLLVTVVTVDGFLPAAGPFPHTPRSTAISPSRPSVGPLFQSTGTQEKGSQRRPNASGRRGNDTDATARLQAEREAQLAARLDAPAQAPPPPRRPQEGTKGQAARQTIKLPNPLEIPIKAGQAARRALEALGRGREPVPTSPDAYRIYFDQKFLYAVPTPNDTTPTVLVVGATGETGRQAVRKLILKGYRVQVLVRRLYSTTLNMLGTGVSYMRGDLTDVDSLRAACDGVDKVLFLAQANNESDARAVEYRGLRNLVQAFQDTRITETGRRLTTKRTLFKFRKDVDFQAWSLAPEGQVGVEEAAWQVQDEKSRRPTFSGRFTGDRGAAVLESKKIPLDLQRFGGFVALFKATGDPSVQYKLAIRTGASLEGGYRFELPLPPVRDRFVAYRLNFADFAPVMENGQPYRGVGPAPPRLDPSDVMQLAIIAGRDSGAAEADAAFGLTLEGIKVFRARPDPDLVVLSSSDITPLLPYKKLAEAESSEREKVERRYYYKAQGELALKVSGLSYCIVRMSDFSSSPSEGRPLSVSRNGNNMGLISRADAAEVCVQCLFNPRVVNTELYASENPRFGDRDVAKLIAEATA